MMKLKFILFVFTATQVFAQNDTTTTTTKALTSSSPALVTTASNGSSSVAPGIITTATSPSSGQTVSQTAVSGTTSTAASTSTTKASSNSTGNSSVPMNTASTISSSSGPIITQIHLATTVKPSQICQCVTTGFCEIAGGVSKSDGAGQLNLRISNFASNVSESGSSKAVTTPASSGINIITSPPKTCDKLTEKCCTSSYKCGLRFPPVKGTQNHSSVVAPFGAYPWQGMIFKGTLNLTSGALIDQWHFLTTAKIIKAYVRSATSLKLRMGEWDIRNNTEPLPFREFQVDSIHVHPNYTELNSKNNIAIVKLRKQVNLGEFPTIGTACLPSSPIPAGIRCWASGWSYLSGNITKQDFQRQVDLPLVDNAACQTRLRDTTLGPKFILDTSSFICAGGEQGKDTCGGDSGVPLVCEVASQFYLTGLTAWGMDCGKKDLPSVYVNVQNYVPWIQSITTPKPPATPISTASPMTSTTK